MIGERKRRRESSFHKVSSIHKAVQPTTLVCSRANVSVFFKSGISWNRFTFTDYSEPSILVLFFFFLATGRSIRRAIRKRDSQPRQETLLKQQALCRKLMSRFSERMRRAIKRINKKKKSLIGVSADSSLLN